MKKHISGLGLTTENMLFNDDKIWFTEIDNNELYYYDVKTQKITQYYRFEMENESRLFGALVYNEPWICCVPFGAEAVYALNTDTGEVRRKEIIKPLEGMYDGYTHIAKFMFAGCHHGHIFMVGASYPAIAEYDIEKNDIVYHSEWFSSLSRYFKTKDNAIFRKCTILNGQIYAPSCKGNAVLKFNMDTYEYQIYQVGDEKCNYSSICYDGEDFWLSPRNTGGIVEWNEENEDFEVYRKYPDRLVMNQNSFNDIIITSRGQIILLPGNANMFLYIDKKNKNICEYDKTLRNCKGVSFCEDTKGNSQYLFSTEENLLMQIKNGVLQLDIIRFETENKTENLEPNIFAENKLDNLARYVDFIELDDKDNGIRAAGKVEIGKKAWNIVRAT
ncbi:MAG: hypothetical protein ACI4AA_07530 [Lachnospiraceae bacterium]